jgi:DNA-binding LacI/PurR family transcriptional regulator
MGRLAAALLLDGIDGYGDSASVDLPPTVVERDSLVQVAAT